MPLYGLDVSEHQNGMYLPRAQAEGYDFVIIRLCDGTYRDKIFGSHLQDAASAGLITSAYWYLRSPSEGSTIAQQVDVIDQQMGGRRDLLQYGSNCHAAGYPGVVDVNAYRGSHDELRHLFTGN